MRTARLVKLCCIVFADRGRITGKQEVRVEKPTSLLIAVVCIRSLPVCRLSTRNRRNPL